MNPRTRLAAGAVVAVSAVAVIGVSVSLTGAAALADRRGAPVVGGAIIVPAAEPVPSLADAAEDSADPAPAAVHPSVPVIPLGDAVGAGPGTIPEARPAADSEHSDRRNRVLTRARQAPSGVARVDPSARVEQARVEQARVEQARVERARVEQARVEQARVDQARLDKERLDKERGTQARIDGARSTIVRPDSAQNGSPTAYRERAAEARHAGTRGADGHERRSTRSP